MSREIVQNLTFKKYSGSFDPNEFSRELEQAYLLDRRPSKITTKTSFAPSSIAYNHARCARFWKYMFDGVMVHDTNDALGIANMANGTLAHDRIQRVLKNAGLAKEIEKEFRIDDPPIHGFIDAIIDWHGEDVVCEIKTTRQESFAVRQATMKPSVNHLYQVLIYLYVTELKNGFLLYESKNDNSFLVIPVVMNDKNKKVIEDALNWLRLTYKTWQDGKFPTRPFTQKSKECKGCPLADLCWQDGPGDIEISPMEVVKV